VAAVLAGVGQALQRQGQGALSAEVAGLGLGEGAAQGQGLLIGVHGGVQPLLLIGHVPDIGQRVGQARRLADLAGIGQGLVIGVGGLVGQALGAGEVSGVLGRDGPFVIVPRQRRKPPDDVGGFCPAFGPGVFVELPPGLGEGSRGPGRRAGMDHRLGRGLLRRRLGRQGRHLRLVMGVGGAAVVGGHGRGVVEVDGHRGRPLAALLAAAARRASWPLGHQGGDEDDRPQAGRGHRHEEPQALEGAQRDRGNPPLQPARMENGVTDASKRQPQQHSEYPTQHTNSPGRSPPRRRRGEGSGPGPGDVEVMQPAGDAISSIRALPRRSARILPLN
jgi:hypothetical protein